MLKVSLDWISRRLWRDILRRFIPRSVTAGSNRDIITAPNLLLLFNHFNVCGSVRCIWKHKGNLYVLLKMPKQKSKKNSSEKAEATTANTLRSIPPDRLSPGPSWTTAWPLDVGLRMMSRAQKMPDSAHATVLYFRLHKCLVRHVLPCVWSAPAPWLAIPLALRLPQIRLVRFAWSPLPASIRPGSTPG